MSGIPSKKRQLQNEFGAYWDFWLAFAWLMTRSEQLLRDAVQRRNNLGSSTVSLSTPFILAEVCRQVCDCSQHQYCIQWQEAWRLLARACAKHHIQSFGIPNTKDVSEIIPPTAWAMPFKTLTGYELDIGTRRWGTITLDAAQLLALFPPKKSNPIGRRPTAQAIQEYVTQKIAAGASQRSIIRDSKSHFHPHLPPSEKALREEHRRQVGYPKRGRPSANRP
jgi:hypothetical protein